MDNDNSSEMNSEDEVSSDGEPRDVPPTSASSKRKFSKQLSVLFYNTGMKGVGEVYSERISQAAKEAGLKIEGIATRNEDTLAREVTH